MAFNQWLWIAYTPEDGNIWSSCVLTLHDTGAITFDGIETGGKWTYTSTSTANTAVAVSYDEHPDTDASRCRGKEKRCDVCEWMRCDRFLWRTSWYRCKQLCVYFCIAARTKGTKINDNCRARPPSPLVCTLGHQNSFSDMKASMMITWVTCQPKVHTKGCGKEKETCKNSYTFNFHPGEILRHVS